MMTDTNVGPFSLAEERLIRASLERDNQAGLSPLWSARMIATLDEERGHHDQDLDRLTSGIKAGLTLRLIAGNTDQVYTPTEVAVMVASVVDEQFARLADR